MSDDLTAAYMSGAEDAKKSAEFKLKELQQENQCLKNLVKGLLASILRKNDISESEWQIISNNVSVYKDPEMN